MDNATISRSKNLLMCGANCTSGCEYVWVNKATGLVIGPGETINVTDKTIVSQVQCKSDNNHSGIHWPKTSGKY